MNCPACESTSIQKSHGQLAPFIALRTGLPIEAAYTCECRTCGLRFSSHRFTPEQSVAIYDGYRGPLYNSQRDQCEPGYMQQYGNLNDTRPYMDEIEKFISPHPISKTLSILDFGGNDGGNTPFPGSHVDIYEVGDPWPTKQYDLIVCAHVLEHVNEQRRTIDALRGTLAQSGLIYVELPIEPPVSTWHEHINQFTQEALTQALRGQVLAIKDLDTPLGPVRMALSR